MKRRLLAACLFALTMVAGTGSSSAAPAVTEFPLSSDEISPGSIVAGPDNALWFAISNHLGRITLDGKVTSYPLPDPKYGVRALALGANGHLWFTEEGPANAIRIGQLTPQGIVDYPLLSPEVWRSSLAPGPKDLLWLGNGSSIVTIATDGTMTQLPVPTPDARIAGITEGPDGNLWFAESREGKIGKLSPSGAVVEYTIPNEHSELMQIKTGSDGNLWFTELWSGKIGRITPKGRITHFSVTPADRKTEHISPLAIVSGPDGRLWFTEKETGVLGWLNPVNGSSGQLKLPPSGSYPENLAVGPDGNVWYTAERGVFEGGSTQLLGEPTPGMIGRITLGPLTARVASPLASVHDRTKVGIRLACEEGYVRGACRGQIRLDARIARRPPRRGFRTIRIASRRYTLPTDEKRRLILSLSDQGLELFAKRNRWLRVQATATVAGGHGGHRQIILQRTRPR